MKKIIYSITILLISLTANSQNDLAKGKAQLNAGFGLSSYGFPVYAGLDFGVAPNVTLGVEGSYRSYNNFKNDIYEYNSSIIGLGANVNYHFNEAFDLPNNFDIYGGATLGYYIFNNTNKYIGPSNLKDYYKESKYYDYSRASGVGLGLQVGTRYFFNDKFGLNLELGGGSTIAGGKFGITYKFNGKSSSKRTSPKKSSSKTKRK